MWQQGPAKQNWAYFLPIANYAQFILHQYQEVGQKPFYSSTPKKHFNPGKPMQTTDTLTHYQTTKLVQIETNCRRFKVHLK